MYKQIIKYLKNYGDSEIRKSFFYGAKGFVAMSAFAWIIWQVSSSHYSTENESLRSSLKSIESAYNTLSKKTEGLFEPQLVIIDTLKERNDRTWAHLSDVYFNVVTSQGKLIRGKDQTGPLRLIIEIYDHRNTHRITIPLGQPYEYVYRESKYYVIFSALKLEEEVIIAETYKLEPIFKKAPLQLQDDSL